MPVSDSRPPSTPPVRRIPECCKSWPLFSGILFFSTGLDRQLIRLLAASFVKFPAGSWAPAAASLDGIVRLGSDMLSLGLRLALPVVALLILIDFALALLGRVQQHLQLLSTGLPGENGSRPGDSRGAFRPGCPQDVQRGGGPHLGGAVAGIGIMTAW